ncbi:hypothetical protein ANCCEY_01782 [Ancylostoma ceylanicum]|uniref:RUN domain-containing protein n=1 Tax=Ancylostoma ceylanicum TaxID=53326 RepID=A0A0D6M6L7_9BILA|nr:hypothetical protein ANCCEY_01782 [Ancylostoma ceylanicum]
MTSHEKHKSGISKELEIVLKAAITSPYTQRDGVPSEITQNICNVIEAIFIHGLRDPFFVKGSRYAKYPEPNFWPFVSKYSHRSITTEINSLNQIRSEIGRGRPLIVSRRTRRPRKSSRSSSESNSKGSRSQSESASTLADGLTELGTSAHSASQTRVKQSETLDSGIESEHRDNNPGSVSSISDGKENELIRVEETHNTCKDRPENAKDVLEPILSEQPGAPETSADEPQDRCNLDIEMGVQPTEPEAELPDVFDPPADEHQAEGSVDILVRVPELDYRADSVIGTSLHDELFNAEAAPGSNSLLSRSWKKPKTSLLNVDLDETEELLMNTDTEGDDENSSSRKASTAASEHVTAAIITIPRENGVCGIDGLYYCADCMRAGGEMPIPSRVLRSWDWKQRPVSDRGRAFIEANQDTPVIRIDQHNPTLYDHVPVMKTMKTLREQLQIASMYLFNCRESIAEDFRRRVWPRDHLYNDIHAYSISDLILLHNGQLEKQVRGFLKHAVDHVMHCSLCRQKGFICEVCEAPEVIYPFETETTHRCPRCFSVLHAECASKMEDCPKCVRRAKYEIRQEASDLPLG